ncbi:MAG: cyclohexa-1,5-dienecarbonyl-CoA hydratase [Rubrivivax sp.]|nr:cyclohexa-1,5-dienecarbonyl-CoA hydratase [Rubrivivax sp.]
MAETAPSPRPAPGRPEPGDEPAGDLPPRAAAEGPLKVWLDRDGALLRLRLARPKANICDAAMIAALHAALEEHRGRQGLRGVLLDAEGPHFSFGASVEEHLAGRCAAMLASLHALILALVDYPVPILVAVRGQCLGGGLEIALAGGPIWARADAAFGQPEIRLGVFAPAASCLLPWRIGAAAAEDLLWSGRSVSGSEALSLGLVQALADDPEAAALAYFDEHLAPRSAAALACAVAAVRAPRVAELRRRLAEFERLYLDRLMATHDANEGLAAFLARRTPQWEHC